jgi:hypothetical protein
MDEQKYIVWGKITKATDKVASTLASSMKQQLKINLVGQLT